MNNLELNEEQNMKVYLFKKWLIDYFNSKMKVIDRMEYKGKVGIYLGIVIGYIFVTVSLGIFQNIKINIGVTRTVFIISSIALIYEYMRTQIIEYVDVTLLCIVRIIMLSSISIFTGTFCILSKVLLMYNNTIVFIIITAILGMLILLGLIYWAFAYLKV